MVIACVLQISLEPYIHDPKNDPADRAQVFKFYGTFARCILTMFEITLGNWKPPCAALVENVSEFWMLFSLSHKFLIGFSVVSVITGVFIQETFKVANINDEIMVLNKERSMKAHVRKMTALLEHATEKG